MADIKPTDFLTQDNTQQTNPQWTPIKENYLGFTPPGSDKPMFSGEQMTSYRPNYVTPQSQLRQNMATDLQSKVQNVQEQQKALGISPNVQSPLETMGVRIGKEVVAKREYDNMNMAKNRVIEEYLKNAKDLTENQAYAVKTVVNSKLNGVSLALADKVAAWNAYVKKTEMSSEEEAAAAKMWYQTAFTIGGAVAGGVLSGGNPAGVVAGASIGGAVGGAVGQQQGTQRG